jgi:sugar lactone lactonase YvrE
MIRKIVIASDGTATVSTLAGTAGVYGSSDGTGTAASFDWPTGIAADASGNFYVADPGNGTIRKIVIASDGTATVSTTAGKAESYGDTDGSGTTALFNFPVEITIDASGNLYVADENNAAIRKIVIASDGTATVSTLAGKAGGFGYKDGPGTAALFDGPIGIAADASGNLYVADAGNNVIRKIVVASDGTATVSTIIGAYDNPTASVGLLPASIFQPYTVAVDSTGNLYIAVPNAVLTLEP